MHITIKLIMKGKEISINERNLQRYLCIDTNYYFTLMYYIHISFVPSSNLLYYLL